MRLRNILRYLKLWQTEGLISEEQTRRITEYMKEEHRRQFVRLIRVFFIMGAFWLFFGFLAFMRLIDFGLLKKIAHFFYSLSTPLINLAKLLSPDHYRELLGGTGLLIAWGLFQWLGLRIRARSEKEMTKLGYLQDRDLRLGTVSLTIGYICASFAFSLFNSMIYAGDISRYWGKEVIFPWFSLIGVIFFLTIAYGFKDQIALLFSIGFLAHTVGMFTGYFFACYWIALTLPVIQLIVGFLLLFVGMLHIEKIKGREASVIFLFGRTYEASGLLFIFLSLWILSLWGFTQTKCWAPPSAVELWIANILFILAGIGAMVWGAVKEDRMFFNYGITFFIIESYTLFFSRLWNTLGAAGGSLLLGLLLVVTGYILRRLWFKGLLFKKTS